MLRIIIAFSLLTLLACEQPINGATTIQIHNEPGPSYYIHEVQLKDGTRCVVASSEGIDGGVGITCQWSAATVYLEKP